MTHLTHSYNFPFPQSDICPMIQVMMRIIYAPFSFLFVLHDNQTLIILCKHHI